jgi:hypothetical protein
MGFFRRRNPRRFTEADSFRLFMEGVRSLQIYDKEAGKDEPADEHSLNKHLGDAAKFFQDCVSTYPDDILPRYYLGIVLSVRGQIEQARQLRASLGRDSNAKVVKADDLFLQAASLFDRVVQEVDRDLWGHAEYTLLAYAEYNQAQALAKTDPISSGAAIRSAETFSSARSSGRHSRTQRNWDDALRILQKIDPDRVLGKLHWFDRMRLRFSLHFLDRADLNIWLDKHKPSLAEWSAEVTAPLKAKDAEGRAFELQVRVLEYGIQLRKAVYRKQLQLDELPVDEDDERERVGQSGSRRSARSGATVRDYMARVKEDKSIPPDTANDIVADYWNKLAMICWEAAKLNYEPVLQSEWLQRAQTYIDIVVKARAHWAPAQLTLARISAEQGDDAAAKKYLAWILGTTVKAKAPTAPPPTPQPDDSTAISNLILKTAAERNSGSLARLIFQGYAPLSTDTIRKVLDALAGRVDLEFLEQIFRDLPTNLPPPT